MRKKLDLKIGFSKLSHYKQAASVSVKRASNRHTSIPKCAWNRLWGHYFGHQVWCPLTPSKNIPTVHFKLSCRVNATFKSFSGSGGELKEGEQPRIQSYCTFKGRRREASNVWFVKAFRSRLMWNSGKSTLTLRRQRKKCLEGNMYFFFFLFFPRQQGSLFGEG